MKTSVKYQWLIVFCFAIPALITGCSGDKQQGGKQDIMPATLTDSVNHPTGNHKLDSLLLLTTTAKQDTNLAKLYYDIGDIYYNYDFAKAKEYYRKTGDLSKKLSWTEGCFLYSAGYTDVLNKQGLIDSSLVILQEVLEMEKKEMNEKRIASILSNIGNCYNYKRWYETALGYYNEALPIFEKQGDTFKLAHLYYLMGTVYGYMNMYSEGMKYAEYSIDLLKNKPDTLLRSYILISYAFLLDKSYTPDRIEKGKSILLEALRISELNNNRYNLIPIYNDLGNIAKRQYDLNKAEIYFHKALEITVEFGDVDGYCVANRGLSYCEEYKGNIDVSEKYVREALNTAIENDMSEEKAYCYVQLSNLSIDRHDFRINSFYEEKFDSIQNEMINEKTRIYAKEMETKYETEKKELKITTLEKEKQLMTGLIIAGGVVLLSALTTFFFLWRWTIQKKRVAEQQKQLAEQQIRQLEQEKQLIATQAVLDGETQERARLARDLHDGLGSMLTGAKLNLLEMKKDVRLEFADVEHFNDAMEMLDDSIREMRRVAHHLMPDSLSRFGLESAVSDFCSNLPFVSFVYYGDESRLDPKLEVIIYRSIHELVNNALKHAGASKIMVQIIQEPDRIAFTVEDDGCGFDPSAETEGMGLQNIRNRVASYNGMIDIHSMAGEGTEVNVELRVES